MRKNLENGVRTSTVRIPDFTKKKKRGEKIAVLTAYDAVLARLLDEAGLDALLVGDSLGMVALGHDTTLEVTMDMMLHHTRAVTRAVQHTLVIADMPFLSFQTGTNDAVRNAGRLLQAGRSAAVKIEGGRAVLEVVARLAEVGIPVMGHLGVLPQSVHQQGGYAKRGTTPQEAETMVQDALALESAGAFAIVLEAIPAELAADITQRLTIATIGIGAGPQCDGQVLVTSDMLGLHDRVPSFVKEYADLGGPIRTAATAFADDVRAGTFPLTPASAARSGT